MLVGSNGAAGASDSNGTELQFVPVNPCRVVDTRDPNGPFGGPAISANTSRSFAIPQGECDIPSSAAAYSLNVTVVPSSTLGFLSIWPTGQVQPYVSTLNSWDGRIKANAAIVDAGKGGTVSVYVSDTSDVILDINGYFVPGSDSTSLAFYPVTPCRLVDTRSPTGPFGGPSMFAGETRSFSVPLSACSLPSNAGAYSLNFTVVPDGPFGYLSTWPTGQAQPYVSTLNAFTGEVTANAAIVPAGSDGAISVYVTNSSDLVIDVNGYFAPNGTGGMALFNLAPCRSLDTRTAGDQQPFVNTFDTDIVGSNCGIPPFAKAVVANITAVPQGALGYLSLWPDAQPEPVVSTLNAWDGSVTSNMAITPMTDGSVDAYASNPTQLILDVSGYFAPANGNTGLSVRASSYLNKNTPNTNSIVVPNAGLNAFGIADFFGDGSLSLVTHTLIYNPADPSTYTQFGSIHFYKMDSNGNWVDNTSALLSNTTGCLHPRKAVIADFNNDGRPDVFFACHGADAPPYPGEHPHILLSQPGGTYSNITLPITCYCHGASAADVTGDGRPDILVTDTTVAKTPFFLINNGDGTFTPDFSRLPGTLLNMQIYSAELIDFSHRGQYDVFLAGNEPGTTAYSASEFGPTIFPNDGTGKFISTTPVSLLAGPSFGLALDVVFENGSVYLLKVNNAYTSTEIQKIVYPSLTESTIYSHTGLYNGVNNDWVDWIIPYNRSILSEDAAYGVSVPQ
jgi:hypothetical protein